MEKFRIISKSHSSSNLGGYIVCGCIILFLFLLILISRNSLSPAAEKLLNIFNLVN